MLLATFRPYPSLTTTVRMPGRRLAEWGDAGDPFQVGRDDDVRHGPSQAGLEWSAAESTVAAGWPRSPEATWLPVSPAGGSRPWGRAARPPGPAAPPRESPPGRTAAGRTRPPEARIAGRPGRSRSPRAR